MKQTNIYAHQCLAKPPKKGEKHMAFEDLTVPELKTFLGLLLSMGIVQKRGKTATYWSTHAATSTPLYSNTMPCSRFLQINRFLHFVDNEDTSIDHSKKSWKVQNIVDYLCKRFRCVYTPGKHLSVDETMIKFKGRLSCKQYIKIKPIKWGIKLFTVAESTSGYVLNIIPYMGKRIDTVYSKTTQTVLDVCKHNLNRGHHIFLDNYYMSVELVRVLKESHTLACGTINSNRVGLPTHVRNKDRCKHLKRGESLKATKDDMFVVSWKDTKVVHILTSIPGYTCDKTVNRREKNGNLITISRPTIIQLYNQYMGGVDISDQRVATYRRHMKSLTWYLQLFHNMFRLSVIQSYIVYQKTGHITTQRDFTLKIIDGLIGGRTYTHKSAPTHGLSPDCRTNRDLDHAPLKLNTQSRCHVHLNRVDTLFVCGACNVRMCPYPCFQRYHFMSEYKFNDTTKKSKAPKKKQQ